MSEEEGGITPEAQMRQLEERLAEETDRLEKLYVAYKKVEDELAERNAITVSYTHLTLPTILLV